MNMHSLFSTFLITACLTGSAYAADSAAIGVVNFATCITESKSGKKEQENMETIRKQMASMIEDSEKELKEISAKFEDTEFLDTLSPKAEEELSLRRQTLQDDLQRYQGQFYQVLQQAQYQLYQKINTNIAKAAETIASSKKLDYVINKDACFYIRADLDLTKAVISEMDKVFELESKKLSDNSDEMLEANGMEEPAKAN